MWIHIHILHLPSINSLYYGGYEVVIRNQVVVTGNFVPEIKASWTVDKQVSFQNIAVESQSKRLFCVLRNGFLYTEYLIILFPVLEPFDGSTLPLG